MSEAEWKIFRELREVALDRFCERVLAEVGKLAADTRKPNHKRYLALFNLLKRRNEELGTAFDNPRRTNALVQLMYIHSLGLITDEEIARFKPATQESLKSVLRQ